MGKKLLDFVGQGQRAKRHSRIGNLLYVSFLITCLAFLSTNSCRAGDADDPGPWRSISVNRHVVQANRLMQERRYGNARDEYLKAISINPGIVDIHIGLHEACKKYPDWAQDLTTMEKIFELEPSTKKQYSADYGVALYHAQRYDEAIAWLKKGLSDMNSVMLPSPLPPTNKDAVTVWKAPPVEAPVAKPAIAINPDQLNTNAGGLPTTKASWGRQQFTWTPIVTMEERSKLAQNFENACHSECIVVAEYLGYQKGDIHYNHPPRAEFRIVRILKGPPLNKALPLRYEFHDHTSSDPPAGWKFAENMMPGKNSQWILFIPHAVPRLQLFDTYEGSYGRQAATEENLNKIYALLEKRGETLH